MRVAVIGQGYVGLPLAVAASSAGWEVSGFEINELRLKNLQLGKSPVEDISDAVLQACLNSGKYSPTSDLSVITESSIVIFCVPTPVDQSKSPDLSFLESALRKIAKTLRPGTLVINESTSYVGTLRNFVRPILAEFASIDIDHLEFASAPERIDPGNRHWNLKNTPRLVSGLTPSAHQKAVHFYQSFTDQVVEVTSPEIAEMAKLLENTFRLVNIGLINELSTFAKSIDIDIREVVSAASTKPYGFMPFLPGPGIGGHCIPVDPYYLKDSLDQQGIRSGILHESLLVNEIRPSLVLRTALSLSSAVRSLLLLGVAYKAGISDYRESAAERIAKEAADQGIRVFWWDPLVDDWKFGVKWKDQNVDCAIYLVDQPGQAEVIKSLSCPTLDCTGTLLGMNHVTVF